MQRAVQRLVSFATYQIKTTIRRPSRLVLGPYHAGFSIERWKRVFVAVSKLPEQVPIAARRILLPKEIEADVARVFALVTGRLVHKPYPPGYRISRVWRIHLRGALARAGKNPSAGVLAYLSLSVFDLELKKLGETDSQIISQRRRDYNRKHNELSLLRESSVFPENTTVTVDEGTHSNKMDQAFSYYDHIYSGIQKTERLNTIVEIGSGYGRFARIMHQLDPRRCYVLVDLPESLVFAYAFLAVNFPGAKMLLISSAADARIESAGGFDFVFCPVQFMANLSCGEVDLAVNTYSFAEMPQSSVDYLMGVIHKVLHPRYLYSLNTMFSDKDILQDSGGLDGDANEATLNLRPEWRVRSFSLTPAVIDGKYRLTAGAVLAHVPGDTQEAAVSAALAEVDRLPSGHPAHIGNLYFAALWSLDAELIRRFRSELERYCIACKFSPDVGYDFERIGEVRYLKRRVSEANAANETAQSSALRK